MGRALALTAALLLAACGRDAPKLPRLASDATVLAFGDSLTYGTGAEPGESYPALLEARIGRKVVNAGIPGETSAQARERLAEVLDAESPQLVLLCSGGNDMLRRQSTEAMHANLAAMVAAIRARGIAVVLLAVPEPALMRLGDEAGYEVLAEQANVPLVDDVFSEVIGDATRRSDRFHPNAAGYRDVAAEVEKTLREAGAV